MKCPKCGSPEMVVKTLDETLSYGGRSLTLNAMRGGFCSNCGEGVWDEESYGRYIEISRPGRICCVRQKET